MESEECIFCKIATGKLASYKIYEDSEVLAFLDINPINPGHTLVVPKIHEPNFYNLNQDIYTHLMKVVKRLSGVVNEKIRPKKVGIIIAGFDVPHVHVHIIPMHNYHDITSKSLIDGNKANPTNEELKNIAERLYISSRK